MPYIAYLTVPHAKLAQYNTIYLARLDIETYSSFILILVMRAPKPFLLHVNGMVKDLEV